ncbi:hypothetical protein B0G80_3188 [Paraburkholderia sp. BL6669N2]|nr:hypothetical protein B0G80_3188 [Paraburkholderia sp. BL6669N2]
MGYRCAFRMRTLNAAAFARSRVLAQASAADINKDNHSLNLAVPFNIRNHYTPNVFDTVLDHSWMFPHGRALRRAWTTWTSTCTGRRRHG